LKIPTGLPANSAPRARSAPRAAAVSSLNIWTVWQGEEVSLAFGWRFFAPTAIVS
jgi:hypothetical protein